MPADPLIQRDQLVDDLRGAIHSGESGLNYVPRLLRRVLETNAWKERYDAKTRKPVAFESFAEFVRTPPTEGLGADMALINRMVGTSDPDLLRLLRDARKVGRGHKRDSDYESIDSETASYTAQRLAERAPEEYEAVKRGEQTIHRAAVKAGIRRHRIPIRLDSAESAAKTLRTHMPRETLARLADLLTKEDP